MAKGNAETAPPVPDLAGLTELGLIRRIRAAAAAADPQVLTGIGDDAAVVAGYDKTLITTDLLVENVHFRIEKTPPRRLGRKALSVNLSDLAAMAGAPRFALLGLAAPPSFSAAVMDEILAGFLERARESGVSLVGGDVVRGPALTLAVTLVGSAPPPGPVLRSGARAGDLLFVTGTVGDSALGLQRLGELSGPITEAVIAADPLAAPILTHLDPPARIAAGLRLAPVAAGMIDLSDGLFSDLTRLLEESGGLAASVELASLPLSETFRRHFQVETALSGEALQMAAGGGEDYELLFTAAADQASRLEKISSGLDLPITRIGRLAAGTGIQFLDADGREVPPPRAGFLHFPEK